MVIVHSAFGDRNIRLHWLTKKCYYLGVDNIFTIWGDVMDALMWYEYYPEFHEKWKHVLALLPEGIYSIKWKEAEEFIEVEQLELMRYELRRWEYEYSLGG